jgi:flagellar hook-associated protein 3 FlgL
MDINQYSNLSASVKTINKDLAQITTQISSEKKYNKGSEDIQSFSLQIESEKKLSNLEDIQKDIEHANKMLDATEVNITSLEEVIDRVYKELIKVSSSGDYREEDKQIITDMLKGMKKEIVDIGNAKVDGQYVFSGQFTDRKPLDIDSFSINETDGRKEYKYSGSEEKKTIYVDENVKSEYGITGKELFSDTNIISVLDNIINLMENPVETVSNDLNNSSLIINNDMMGSINIKEVIAYENVPGIFQSELKDLNDFDKALTSFNKGENTYSLTDLELMRDDLLLLPTFAANPEGVNKMYDVAEYTDTIQKFSESDNNDLYSDSFQLLNDLKNDVNNPGTPYTDLEKEKFKYMFEVANYNHTLKNYLNESTSENFDTMEINKNFLENKLTTEEDITSFNDTRDKKILDEVKYTNIEQQNSTTINNTVKAAYQTYTDLIETYINDKTPANKLAVDVQKTVMDAYNLGASQDEITQDMQNLADYVPLQDWSPEISESLENIKEIDNMFNMTKNPISNSLKEWEDVRGGVSLLHSKVGNQVNYFTQVNNRVSEQHLSLEVFYNENIQVDLAQASMDLQSKSNSLQALYSVIAKIQGLSLTNYL